MHRHALVQARGAGSVVHAAVQLPGQHRTDAVHARKQPSAVHDQVLRLGVAPPGAQSLQHQRREDRVAVLPSLRLLDAQHHPLAVDIASLQGNNFAGAKPRPVGQRQGRLHLQIRRRLDQQPHFLETEHHRQPLLHSHPAQLGHHVRPIQRDLIKKLHRRERRVERDRRHARLDQVQLESPQIFGRRGLR